jgi:regulation of enolase protein 1 (concanavalin A-like superfamily)
VKGAGADIWDTADAFQFAYTTLTGDGRIIARIKTVSTEAAWVKAGVMIRETLDPSSRHGLMLVSNTKGLAFQRRTATGGLSTNTSGGASAAPRWVRLDRVGTTITAYQSADGNSWTVVGSDTIPMAAQVYVGLAVSSHTLSAVATGTIDSISVGAIQPSP